MIRRLSQLDIGLWKSIRKLYGSNPLAHVYLFYDVIYEPETIDVFFNVVGGEIVGYLLIWKGMRRRACHLWGASKELIANIPYDEKLVIVIHNRKLLDHVTSFLQPKGTLKVREYMDMFVHEESFKPFHPEKATKLRLKKEEHIDQLTCLERTRQEEFNREKAVKLLSKYRCYGVFINDKLVSQACTFFRLQEVWPIGNVYTHPNYRERGYAKIVTSAITRDAIQSGAKALLHVASDNTPAIRVYRKIGYQVLSRKPWVFYEP